jgi:hypothetical protein
MLHHRELARRFGQLYRTGPEGQKASPPESFEDVDVGLMETTARQSPKTFFRDEWAMCSGRCGLLEKYHATKAAEAAAKVLGR